MKSLKFLVLVAILFVFLPGNAQDCVESTEEMNVTINNQVFPMIVVRYEGCDRVADAVIKADSDKERKGILKWLFSSTDEKVYLNVTTTMDRIYYADGGANNLPSFSTNSLNNIVDAYILDGYLYIDGEQQNIGFWKCFKEEVKDNVDCSGSLGCLHSGFSTETIGCLITTCGIPAFTGSIKSAWRCF